MTIISQSLSIDGVELTLTPDACHEYLMTTEQVAVGYDVTPDNIRKHKETKSDELVEGKHWVVSNTHTLGGSQLATLWTKRGIVRLGFFIRSKRARLFRDLAEDLVIEKLDQAPPAPALISGRQFAQDCGLTVKAASMRLLRSGILPTHHFADPRMNVPAYLYPLAEVQAYWPEYTMTAHSGAAKPGLPRALKPTRGQREQALFSPLTPLQQLGAELVEQLVAEFMRDELPVRFKAALRGSV